MNIYGSLLTLPMKGKAMVITDIHGNIDDLNNYLEIWNDINSENNHLIFTGDFIHGIGAEKDESLDVLETLMKLENSSNVHLLLGNHEWALISKKILFKGTENLSESFQILLEERYGNRWEEKLEEYILFFKKLPLAVKTMNKIFISHAGPPKDVKDLDEIINIKMDGYVNNPNLIELLWNREKNYSNKDLSNFLKAVGCKAMIVGHTPVKGLKLIDKKLLIVSSSFSKGKKTYMELDLEKEIKNGKDLLKMAKYMD